MKVVTLNFWEKKHYNNIGRVVIKCYNCSDIIIIFPYYQFNIFNTMYKKKKLLLSPMNQYI